MHQHPPGAVVTAISIARAGMWMCLAGATLGGLGLIGWVTETTLLTTAVPGLPPMSPNTALALLLVGTAAAARRRPELDATRRLLLSVAALIVVAIGVGTLIEYGLGVDLYLHRLFVPGQAAGAATRPAPLTAFALSCLGAALLGLDRRGVFGRLSQWLILCAGFAAFVAGTGIALGAEPVYGLTRTPPSGFSLPMVASLLLTSIGLLLEFPRASITRVATSSGPGGVLLRRLALPALVVPLALSLAVMRLAEAQGIEGLALPFAVLTSMLTIGSLFVLGAVAVPLNRAHNQLQASRAHTRLLLEQAPDGIFVADLDGRYTDVNDAGCRLLGYSREEIIGKTIVDLLPPEDVGRLHQSKEQLLSGATHVAEWKLRHKNGSYLPVEVSARILPDGRWQGFVRNISVRKRLEEELRLAEAKASGILSISADAIVSIDAGQKITLFNEGAEKMFGYSKNEVIGSALDILIPEHLRAVHRRHVDAFAASHAAARKMGTRETTIVGRRKSGAEFPADAAISKFEVGGTTVLTAVIRDVTEQKRIENEQRFLGEIGPALANTLDYDETLSRIAENAARGLSDFCIVDLVDDSGAVSRLRVASRDPARAWIGEVLQRVPLNQQRLHLIRSALETRQPVLVHHPSPEDVEAVGQGEDDRRALQAIELQSAMIIPLVAHSRLLGVISFLSVTPLRLFQPEDLRVANELAQRAALAVDNARLYSAARRAIKARDEVLGIVAHDLRNPLAAILMRAGLLTRSGSAERAVRESAEGIKLAALRMNRLIQDLLDVTRLEAGQLNIEQMRVPASEIVVNAVESQRAQASSGGLQLRLDLPANLPDLWVDRNRLLQVFENLLGNAIKFTPRGGTITVGAASRQIDVLFKVGDTGPGISAEDQKNLFDRFWQARAARRSGAGLGLAIVKGIVEAHGGQVWVESVPDKGSTFFFTIPAPHTARSPVFDAA